MASGSYYNILIVTFVALGSFTYGFNSAIMGVVIGLPEFFDYFGINLNDETGASITGATNGLYSGGGVIGCICVPWFLQNLGRRRTIQLGAILAIISAGLQAGSIHIAMFLAARFLNGISVGMLNTSIPIFQSEVSRAHERGKMVGMHGVLVVCGYSSAGFIGFGTYFAERQVGWRLCLAIQIVAPLLLTIGQPWLPESPRWLVSKDRSEEGYKVLRKLHHHDDDPNDHGAKTELYQIIQQIHLERSEGAPNDWPSMFKKKSYRKRLLLGFATQFIAQSTGVLVVNNYQVLLYRNLGITGSLPLALNGVYNAVAATMNWVNAMFLDRLGRIRIMLIGLTGCALSLSCFTAMVATFGGTENRLGNGFGIFFMFLFVFFYGGSMDATSYVYCSEIFPTAVRAQGNGFSVAGLFTATLIYTQIAPTAFAQVGWRYYLVFIITPLSGAVLMWKFFPETTRLSLEEIAGLFGDDVAVDLSHLSAQEKETLDKNIDEMIASATGQPSGKMITLEGQEAESFDKAGEKTDKLV